MAATRKDDTIIEFTFGLDEPEAEDGERKKFAKNLLKELRQRDEVERANRAEDLNPEAGSKDALGFLVGVLTTEVSFKNFKAFLGWLGSRLQDKPIKGSIKVGDNQVTFEVKNPQQLPEFEKTALKLIAALSDEDGEEEKGEEKDA